MIGFDEFDEEEMMDLLWAMPLARPRVLDSSMWRRVLMFGPPSS